MLGSAFSDPIRNKTGKCEVLLFLTPLFKRKRGKEHLEILCLCVEMLLNFLLPCRGSIPQQFGIGWGVGGGEEGTCCVRPSMVGRVCAPARLHLQVSTDSLTRRSQGVTK